MPPENSLAEQEMALRWQIWQWRLYLWQMHRKARSLRRSPLPAAQLSWVLAEGLVALRQAHGLVPLGDHWAL
jgi:hypothetical protein